jgi:hypothetical protein
MYKGTLINDLMTTVERAEKRAVAEPSQEEKLAYWYAAAQSELAHCESNLAGVA